MVKAYIETLSRLVLSPPSVQESAITDIQNLRDTQREDFLKIADAHHVIVRVLTTVAQWSEQERHSELQVWANLKLDVQQVRVKQGLERLNTVCRVLEEHGCKVTVVKSLDHRPDLGNDFDLYTSSAMETVVRVLTTELHAQPLPQSWGDRLARKMSFAVPGMQKTIEMHSGRLGQTGEHVELAARFERRRRPMSVEGYTFYIPSAEEQVLAATMQRMYRHLFFRISDIANTLALSQAGAIDLSELQKAACRGGIWPGVATYLRIVSEYAERYGNPMPLQSWVKDSALFGAEQLFVGGRFLRLPVFPHGMGLYARQVGETISFGKVDAAFRLSLLPPLASAAAVAFKLTGNNQGIW
jgi:hypothetical protein